MSAMRDETKARALAATQGPWGVEPNGRGGLDVWAGHGTDEVCVAQAMTRADAEHIAGMDPAATLALVEDATGGNAPIEWVHLLRWLTASHSATTARAEAAEAERDAALAQVAAVESLMNEWFSEADHNRDEHPRRALWLLALADDLRAALATREGQ